MRDFGYIKLQYNSQKISLRLLRHFLREPPALWMTIGTSKKRFRRAKAIILAENRGLEVGQMTELRKRARNAGVYLRVVKNTLARRAVAVEAVVIHRDRRRQRPGRGVLHQYGVDPRSGGHDKAKDADAGLHPA